MPRRVRNETSWRLAILLLITLFAPMAGTRAASSILFLKNGDRLSGRILSEGTNSVILATPYLGNVQVPLAEITKRERIAEPAPAPVTNSAPGASIAITNLPPANAIAVTNGPALATTAGTNAPPKPAATNLVASPVLKKKPAGPKPPLTPANPEATPIASTPNYWKHDFRFGLNLRYAAKDSHEVLAIAKSTYGKAPFRHIFDGTFKYGTIEGVLSANSLTGSEKTEYQLSPKTYIFSLVGGGFDEIRHIDAQFEVGPGFGVELLKLTNFVWKGEMGFNFQQQYRTDRTRQTAYSIRIAEIFAWRIWEKLTADAKIEFFPNLAEFGEFRFRLESTLRYPVSDRLSLNLDLIDIYDSDPASEVRPNDMQIRSTIGVTF